MKRFIIILIAVAVGALGIGFVLSLFDSAEDQVVAKVEVEVEPEPISFFDLKDTVAAPVIRQEKVARYVTLSARFELEGEGALEKARELAPRLRDDIVRRLNKTPVPLLEDSRDLDPDRLRELFLASGRRVLGREIVKDVLVEPARASQPAAPEPAPAPRREGGGH